MIKDRFYAGHTMVIIDSGGTYRHLFEALGGKYVDYQPQEPLKLNPFLIDKKKGKYAPDALKINFLIDFLGKMWREDLKADPITAVESSLFSDFLTFYYESLSEKDVPTLTGFCEWLPVYIETTDIDSSLFNLKNFIIALKPFTHGMYKQHFNSLEIAQLEDSRLLCFELGLVKSDARLYPLVVQVLFDHVMHLTVTKPEARKFIDIEEGWSVLDNFSNDYIEKLFRGSRKTNTSIRIITQSIDEIKDSKIVGAMKGNNSTTILLYNDKESVRKDIADFLGMNEFDMEKYASLRSRDDYFDGYREVFIKEMDQSAVWRVGTSIYEHAILTSQPDERNEIARLKREKGNIEEAVIEWVNSINERNKT
jgi:conjugal transfer ATP-binding protein TraC